MEDMKAFAYALDNNATYVANIVLNTKAKNLTVNVQNSGYRPAGR